MGDRSGIQWTDATWNPVTGCTVVSAGCDHCYARTLAHGKLKEVYGAKLPVVDTEDNRADTFAVRLWPERMEQPLRWSRPRMIFVNSMSDLFHVDVPDAFVRRCFEVMLQADHHVYQVLTKRPGRMARFARMNADLWPQYGGLIPEHIWMGTSVENQEAAFRVPQLLSVPAEIHFLSCEPLIGPLDLETVYRDVMDEEHGVNVLNAGIDWVIGGGESGEGFRTCHIDWARSLRDQCVASGTAFFWKQWGGRTPKSGGRLLDGLEWNEYPSAGQLTLAPQE